MSLEIKVYDNITICDSLVETQKVVAEIIEKWFKSSDEKPLTIIIKKNESTGPPSLKINVVDIIKSQTGLV